MNKQIAKDKFLAMKQMMEKYGLQTAGISSYIDGIDSFHVTSPLVGRFSTGKSALLNSLLGKKYLSEDTQPETAIPTEIIYGDIEKVTLVKKDRDTKKVLLEKHISMEDFIGHDFNIKDWSTVKLRIPSDFLKTVPDVRVVDMPGFGTNIELHNKAINEYLPESKAYILTFQARNSTIEEDTLEFLKELKFHDMPVYVVVTKSGSVLEEQREQCVENLKQQLHQDVGLDNVPICCTNAKGRHVDIEGLKQILTELEKQSASIFEKETKQKTVQFGTLLQQYLRTALHKIHCSVSELETEKEKREKHIALLKEKLASEKADFQSQIPGCMDSIASDVGIALEDFAGEFADLAMAGRNETAKERVNSIVRTKVEEGMKRTFEPKVEKYLQSVSNAVKVDVPEMNLQMSSAATTGLTGLITAELVKKGLVSLLAAIGMKIPMPIIQIVSAAVAIVASIWGNSNKKEEQRQKAIQQFRTEFVPQVSAKVKTIVEDLVRSQADQISQTIDTEVDAQVQAEEKALNDLIEQVKKEQEEKEKKEQELQQDWKQVETWMDTATL